MARLIINQSLRNALPEKALAAMNGVRTLEVEAVTVRGLLQELDQRYPGSRKSLEQGMAVAIDGDIHADALLQPLAADSEVCFVPAIEGG
ncbi:MAG: MoaD/ThiS family protein [Pseudohongiellaceae bacterium]